MAAKEPPPQADVAKRTEAVGGLVAKLIAATPFALATLAVLYDAGYFARIGLDFFSLFSLTEHLMFGMAGIPYLLIVLVLLYFALAIGALLAGRRDLAERARAERQYNQILAISFLFAGVVSLFLYPWPNAALCFVGALTLGLWTLFDGPLKAIVIIAGNFVIWMLASFVTGYWIGAGVSKPPGWSAVATVVSNSDDNNFTGRRPTTLRKGFALRRTRSARVQYA